MSHTVKNYDIFRPACGAALKTITLVGGGGVFPKIIKVDMD
jgi:hypothetical protein